MAIALRHRLQLPGELVMLFCVVGMSEGLGAQLDPDFRLFEFATPFLQHFWLERRSPKAMALRAAQAALDAPKSASTCPNAPRACTASSNAANWSSKSTTRACARSRDNSNA